MRKNSVPITVVGNLTDDPKMRFTPAGVAVARFTVAFNPRQYDRSAGEWRDGEPSFYRCTAWRELAENVTESLVKGVRVVVTGTLAQRQWKDEASGETRSSWDLTVEAIGPDLAYARATVQRMARAIRGEVPPDDAWATATGSREPVPAGAGASDGPPF